MTDQKQVLFLRRRYSIAGIERWAFAEAQKQLDVLSDRVTAYLLDQEKDGLTTDSTVSLDLAAMDLTIELIVKIGDSAVAAQVGGSRMDAALRSVGVALEDGTPETTASVVQLTNA